MSALGQKQTCARSTYIAARGKFSTVAGPYEIRAPLRTSEGQTCIAGRSRTKHSSMILVLKRAVSELLSMSTALTCSFSTIAKASKMSTLDVSGSDISSIPSASRA